MQPAQKWLVFSLSILLAVSLSACSGAATGGGFSSGAGSSSGSGSSGSSGSGSGSGSGGGTTTSSTFSISGTVLGLTGSGLVIEDNGGDDIAVSGTGTVAFTFKTLVSAYSVTVKTQPSSPAQTCGVSNGAGTATANVTTVQVVCGPVYTVSGTISGLIGSGLTLQDNGSDTLKISGSGNVAFTFATPLTPGSKYAVTVQTQPATPVQTCVVSNASGTIAGNITNVQVTCSQPAFSVSGAVVGLVPGTGDTLELQDNAGDNLFVTGDVPFTFPTPVTNGGVYNVSMFLPPTSQPQPCTIFNGFGVATSNVTNVVVDCQHNDWTWKNGPNTENEYGTIALEPDGFDILPPTPAAPDVNTPGGRDFSMTWTDLAGRKWLFGGFGYPVQNASFKIGPGFLNDLWVLTPQVRGPGAAGAWAIADNTTDVSATFFTDAPGVYGAGGAPGARWGGVSWTDASGNLWMFGGQGFDSLGIEEGLLNDVWEFSPGSYSGGEFSGNWTFVGGNTTANHGGVYGTKGTGSAGNLPGGRWAAANYKDNAGNVWLFGGQGYDSVGNAGLLNDLWKYNIASGQWTWVSGGNTANANGVYGTQGTAAGTNVPGGRQQGIMWVDSTGAVWLFGGFGLDSAGTPNGTLNDLWKFDGTNWTWVSGGGASGLADQNGTYGTQTQAAAGNVPGSRWGPVSWTDSSDNLWLFGGWGYDSNLTHGTGFLNDVWEYQKSTQQWIWWKGSSSINQSGTYSVNYDVPYVGWTAGARRGSSRWLPDALHYVWIFGGQGYDSTNGTAPGYLNDLWTYLPFP